MLLLPLLPFTARRQSLKTLLEEGREGGGEGGKRGRGGSEERLWGVGR